MTKSGEELGGDLANLYYGSEYLKDAVHVYNEARKMVDESGSLYEKIESTTGTSLDFWSGAVTDLANVLERARDNIQTGADVLIAMAVSFAEQDQEAAARLIEITEWVQLPEYEDGKWNSESE